MLRRSRRHRRTVAHRRPGWAPARRHGPSRSPAATASVVHPTVHVRRRRSPTRRRHSWWTSMMTGRAVVTGRTTVVTGWSTVVARRTAMVTGRTRRSTMMAWWSRRTSVEARSHAGWSSVKARWRHGRPGHRRPAHSWRSMEAAAHPSRRRRRRQRRQWMRSRRARRQRRHSAGRRHRRGRHAWSAGWRRDRGRCARRRSRGRHRWRVGEKLVGPVGLGKRVLSGEQTLGRGAVAFTLGVLLEGVADGDGSVAQVL